MRKALSLPLAISALGYLPLLWGCNHHLLPAGVDLETLTVTVSPYRIVMDVLLGREPRQDFALVISNFLADE